MEEDHQLHATRFVPFLAATTGAGILLQWLLVWVGLFPVVESTPGFRNYFLSFVAADMWMVIAAIGTTWLSLRNDQRAILASVALGSAQLFFGLQALLYDFHTGLLFVTSAAEWFSKGVTISTIVVGLLLMGGAWRSIGRNPG